MSEADFSCSVGWEIPHPGRRENASDRSYDDGGRIARSVWPTVTTAADLDQPNRRAVMSRVVFFEAVSPAELAHPSFSPSRFLGVRHAS